jgi:hypothetical protein
LEQYTSLKKHYKFTEEEEAILKQLQPQMEDLADQFVDEFYDYI